LFYDNALFSLGFIFEDFKEGTIRFPPTHKFYMNTNQYVTNRIPSYTVSITPFTESIISCCLGQGFILVSKW
jgi:hypothetical protein